MEYQAVACLRVQSSKRRPKYQISESRLKIGRRIKKKKDKRKQYDKNTPYSQPTSPICSG
jgi:hypothetical protein